MTTAQYAGLLALLLGGLLVGAEWRPFRRAIRARWHRRYAECECCLGEFRRRHLILMRSPNTPRGYDDSRLACKPCADTGGHGLGWWRP